MSKESFNWKSLFVNDEGNSSKNEEKPSKPLENTSSAVETKKFPDEKIISNTTNNDTSNNPFVAEILEVYEKGFDSLNLEDFDFKSSEELYLEDEEDRVIFDYENNI